jgi:hypothetical protein
MTDFLEAKQREIEQRLNELRPLVDEFHRLEAAAGALQGAEAPASPSRPAPRSSDSASAGRSANSSGRGRPRGSGTRGNEALDLVKRRPGITIPELADAMGIKQNYLYRVLPGLAQEGLVEKRGRGWHARVAA